MLFANRGNKTSKRYLARRSYDLDRRYPPKPTARVGILKTCLRNINSPSPSYSHCHVIRVLTCQSYKMSSGVVPHAKYSVIWQLAYSLHFSLEYIEYIEWGENIMLVYIIWSLWHFICISLCEQWISERTLSRVKHSVIHNMSPKEQSLAHPFFIFWFCRSNINHEWMICLWCFLRWTVSLNAPVHLR